MHKGGNTVFLQSVSHIACLLIILHVRDNKSDARL